MKKLTLLCFTILSISIGTYAQSTAIDFTLTDCDGNSRTLFPIIDSGNVVVLVYEHQCSSCQVGATNLKNAINLYFASDKNIRVMYLDNGGYSCTSVKTWITSHSFIPGPAFAYSNTQSSPYGAGMPVIVVTATKSHKVYLIANSVTLPTVLTLKGAIQNAQTDITTGINSGFNSASANDIYPNPVTGNSIFVHNTSGNLQSIEISNISGQIVMPGIRVSKTDQQQEINLNNLENGIYFVRLNTSEGTLIRKMILNR
jgi:hypothetical protein